jgi:hypothetical protein
MSNRFHSKFHRSNHHTYGIEVNPDTGHDPIASRDLPFRGDFILQGALSAMASLSAYAGYFYSNNTALCAIAGTRGAHIITKDNLGIEVKCVNNTAISARAFNIGVETLSDRIALSAYGLDYGIITGSPKIALSAHGTKIAIDAFSPNFAISAFGEVRGMDVASNNIALSAWGNNIASVFVSPRFALSAYGFDRGIDVASNNVGISSWGGKAAGIFMSDVVALSTNSSNQDGYPDKNNPYFGPNYKSKNVLNNRTGIFTENPLSAFHVTGGSLFDGHVTVTGNLSVAGDLSRFDTYVFVTSSTQIILNNSSNTEPALYVSNTGNNRIVEFYDADSSVTPTRPSFVVDGSSDRPGCVGINVGLPNEKLTILGNISAQGNLSATYIHVTPFLGTYTALPNTRAAFNSYVNSYSQVNHQNLFTGNNASSDFIATTDTGTDSTGFIDLGINNSSYNQYGVFDIVGSGGGYLYTQGGDLAVGTGAAKNLVFFTGATLSANERMRIDSSGNINIGNSITGVGAATLKVKGQTDINITGGAATNIGTGTVANTVTVGNSLATVGVNGLTTVLGTTNINNSGSSATNIGTSTTATTVTVGNPTGPTVIALNGTTTALGTTNINNSGSSATNIGTSATATTVTVGNAEGPTTIALNGSTTLLGATNINNSGALATNIATGTGNVALGNASGSNTILGQPININDNNSGDATNIATGNTTGTVSIGNNTVGATTAILGATTTINGTSVSIGSANTSTLNIGTNSGLATTQGNSSGGHTLNSNNITAPNQVVNANSSVLTRTAGDTRYGQTVSNSTVAAANTTVTLANTVGGIALEANTVYDILAVAVITVAGNTATIGSKVAFEGDGTLTFVYYSIDEMYYNSSAPTTPTTVIYSGAPNSATISANTTQIAATGTHYYRRRMTLRTGTAGTLSLKNAVITAGGTNSTTPATGSFIFARKIT